MTYYDVSTLDDFEPAATVLAEIQAVATRLGIEVMVVGAVARDIIVRRLTGTPPVRATRDVDVAVSVESWDELAELTDGMTSSGQAAHRFTVLGVPVDVVPFGGIEAPDRSITWPDDHTMTVLGFREAWSNAVIGLLPNGVAIRLPSLAAQSILKVLAWNDRHDDDSRDAVDLATLLEAQGSADQLDRLYDDHGDRLRRYDFDPVLAGAEVVGAEAAMLLGQSGRAAMRDLLAEQPRLDLLAAEMRGMISRRRAMLDAYVSGWGFS
jgi:predicted nucleotidyltransferase